MPQLAIAAVGAYIGGAAITGTVLGMTGAAIGWSVGSVLGSLLFAPDGARASLQDTRAAKLQFGAKMPRVYGRARLPLNPRWQSDWRATSQEAGGKGGGGSEYFTYSADGLFWVADGDNVITGVRVWHNGELVWSSLAESDADSLAASAATPLWSAITFWPGTAAQMPWPVYEASVGSANADAHRGMFCVSIENYQAGQTPNWQLLEVEVITAGAQGGAAIPEMYPFTGRAYSISQSSYPGGSDQDVYTNALYARAAGDWRLDIIGFVFTSSGLTVNNNIVTWRSDAAAPPGPYRVYIYLRSTGGQLSVSFENTGGMTGPSGAACNGDISLRYTAADLTARLYVNNSLVATDVVAPAGYPAGTFTNSVTIGPLAPTFGTTTYSLDRVELTVNTGTPDTWTVATEDLADIAAAECTRCGLTAGLQDHAELVGTPVTGVVFSSSGRHSMETLAGAYYFGATGRDQLITRLRGAASVVTVPFNDSGAGLDQAGEPFTGVTRGNDREVPAYWVVSSPDLSNNYETGTEESGRAVTTSVERRQVQLLVVFTPAERKGRAIAMALDAAVGSHTCSVSLPDTYAQLEPFDVITLTDEEGNTYRVRLVRETYAQGVKSFEGVLDDVAALPTTGTTSAPHTPTIVVAAAGSVEGILLDGPIARDADDEHGFYWVTDLADGAAAASLLRSTDDISFANLTNSTADAITGTASTALANWAGGYLVDDTNTVRVVVSGALSAATDAAILEDDATNAFALGVHGRWEYGQFKTPTLISSSGGLYTYDLTGLLRGRRGSEAAMSAHVVGDTFILMRLAGLRRAALDSGEVGLTRYYKSVPAGVLASTIASESFVNAAVGRKPYSPVHCEVDFDGSNDATITWLRRSRLACRFVGAAGINCPLGEASEAYEVDVYASNAFAAVVRTISTTAQTATYTSAQQTADGLTPGNPLNLRIYQLSETVGRGSVLEEAAP